MVQRYDWAYQELADLEIVDYDAGRSGFWTRGLLIQRNIADGDLAFLSTWCPAGTPIETLVRVEGQRWAIEDSFETAKNALGLDHNETRSWHGWHRHVWGFPGFAMTAFRAGDRPWAVPILRGAKQGHFQPDDTPRLKRLIPHLARMIRLSEKLALRHATAELDTLDRVGCAAILLDWRGQVLRVNARADRLLGTDLQIQQGTLIASDTRSNQDLRQLLAWVRAIPRPDAQLPPSPVFIRRRQGNPHVIEALPVSSLTADLFRRTRALLIITELQRRPQMPEDLLRKAFGLTTAEARLAARLAVGDRIDDAAEAFGVTKNTARVQLKSVFLKTNTNRQADLIALINSLPHRGLE